MIPSKKRIVTLKATSALVLIATMLPGCRTAAKASRIPANLGKLSVTLIGVETPSQEANSQYPRAYELTGCVERTNGTLEADGTVSFQAEKFSRDQTCELKIRALYSSPDLKYITEPGVLYWGRNIRVVESMTGQLIARANMQPVFERMIARQPGRTFTIQVPVIYKPAENDAPVTASLDCTPRMANVAQYPDANTANQTFEFVAEVRTDTKFACKYLWVSAGGIGQKYQGTLAAVSFEGYPDAVVKLDPVELREVPRSGNIQGALPGGGGAVDVTTSPGACAADEVFNTLTRMCEKN
ncbi:MAG: hypothetical protein RIQ81_2520 [Pseudomonadota bacterium]|jgi:hypothetical protein